MQPVTRIPSGAARVPAVVVGAAGVCGLGVIRSLGRAGIPIVLVDNDPAAPAMHCRFARKITVPQVSGPSLVDRLLTLSATFDEPAVLFLTTDEAVLTVSEHRAALAGRYRVRLPSHERVVSLMHKTTVQRFAELHGFPVPRSIRIEGLADLGALRDMTFPAIAKPAIKTPEYLREKLPRAYKVASRAHAEAVCRRVLDLVPGLIVQEWIGGSDRDLYFCLQYRGANGAVVCSFTGRKLSIWPRDVGVTASCTAAPDAQEALESLTDAFFRPLSFVGMGAIEFKRDPRTGQFLIIEPTVGRVDAQEEVATLHGSNIPLAAYRYEAGLPVPGMESRHHVPVVWKDSLAHLRSARDWRVATAARPHAKTYDAYWRLDDPMPALFHLLGSGMRCLRGAARSLVTGFETFMHDLTPMAHGPESDVTSGKRHRGEKI